MRRVGCGFEQMVEALSATPGTADWVREKGRVADKRELCRVYYHQARKCCVGDPEGLRLAAPALGYQPGWIWDMRRARQEMAP